MFDCWMSLDLDYATRLAHAARTSYGLKWIEEALPPDDYWGYAELRRNVPRGMLVTTGEHEATRWGFRMLLEMDCCDIIQPDVGWCGGITELLKISALADAHGKLVVPHGSSVYSYHFVVTRHNSPFAEFLMMAPEADKVVPMFRPQLLGEPVPVNGRMKLSALDSPGFGVELNPRLRPCTAPTRTDEPGPTDMRIARLGEPGAERPSWSRDGTTYDLSPLTADIDGSFLADDGIPKVRDALAAGRLLTRWRTPTACVSVPDRQAGSGGMHRPELRCPCRRVRRPLRRTPDLFFKHPNTVVGPVDDVRIPPGADKVDWEVELAVVIGRQARYLASPSRRPRLCRRVHRQQRRSERAYQVEQSGGQWSKGKCCETFNPLGPHLVPADEVADVQAMRLWSTVNDEPRQDSTTADMIFSVAYLVWHLSQYLVLIPATSSTPVRHRVSRFPDAFRISPRATRCASASMSWAGSSRPSSAERQGSRHNPASTRLWTDRSAIAARSVTGNPNSCRWACSRCSPRSFIKQSSRRRLQVLTDRGGMFAR